MSRHVPMLTEVVTRAWGLDDARVLSHLRAENQPGRHRRTKVLTRRAIDAGWPVIGLDESRKAAVAAVRRLEGMDWSFRGQQRMSAQGFSRRRDTGMDVYETDEQLVSIFDE